MNIIYVVSGTNLAGGATKSFLTLVRGVCAEGHKVIVVCPDSRELYQLIDSGSIPGATAAVLDYTYDIYPFLEGWMDYVMFLPRLAKRILKNRVAARRLSRLAAAFKADIIHTNTSVNNIGYLAAGKLGIPHVWHIREYGKSDFRMAVPFQSKKLRAKNNYTVSITSDIRRYKGLSGNPSASVIYNGLIEESEIVYEPNDDGYFLYAGRVTERKGFPDLVEAYATAASEAESKFPPLLVAGRADAGMESASAEMLRRSGGYGEIKFLGERDDVSVLMRRAHAVIVPSLSEGFGRVMPEAMAEGALVIGRDTAGTKEQLDNGRHLEGCEIGLRFTTVRQLANHLKDVAGASKSDYRSMIEASQRVVGRLYGKHSYVAHVIGKYEEILKEKNTDNNHGA